MGVQLVGLLTIEQNSKESACGVEMSNALQYVNLTNMKYLTDGLTFNLERCADVLDANLIGLNEKTRIPDNIVSWNETKPSDRAPLAFRDHGRIIVEICQSLTKRGPLFTATVLEAKEEKETAPVVFFRMRSPTLDIPMRVEIPLRALIKGGPSLEGTYSVYLHALICNDGREFIYYGITKRGWNKRFTEHLESALGEESQRLFPAKLKELTFARAEHIKGATTSGPMLTGVVNCICGIGLDEDAAMDAEEYLVDKYSLSSKHPNGLNMIPGGREGIRVLRKLSPGGGSSLTESDDREAFLDGYLKTHPHFGKPNPGVAESWNDPAYAEAVICGRANRLSADQVREIRYLAATGNSIQRIKDIIGALDDGQVSRVLVGRTYSRIQ
jgi:hypothetical protein